MTLCKLGQYGTLVQVIQDVWEFSINDRKFAFGQGCRMLLAVVLSQKYFLLKRT